MKVNLFIGSHPDDIEIGCGGTVAKLRAQNHKCVFIIATNGDQGSLKYTSEELGKIRKQEAIDAAKNLQVDEVEFLNLPDGLTSYQLEHKIQLIGFIRKHKPDTVFTHSKFDQHPDHKIIHDLSVNAVKAAAGPWFPSAQGRPHYVSNLLGYEVWNPINEYQTAVDITDYLEQKVQALKFHKSQTQDYPYTDAVRGLAHYRGAMINGKGAAEVFEVLRLKTY